MARGLGVAIVASLLVTGFGSTAAAAPGNGKLQIHVMDVGQGDGVIVISPTGRTLLVDGGEDRAKRVPCSHQVGFLDGLGIGTLDFLLASSFEPEHIGCTAALLEHHPVTDRAYDHGGAERGPAFAKYERAVGTLRAQAHPGECIDLGGGAWVEFIAMNGDRVEARSEGDRSVVAVLHYGSFDLELGGDLGGFEDRRRGNVESAVAPRVGRVEVAKVHDHCSRFSSNSEWLEAVRPKVGLVSAGSGRKAGQWAKECTTRLRTRGVELYWTEGPEKAKGLMEGPIFLEVEAGGAQFTVTGNGTTHTYDAWPDAAKALPAAGCGPAGAVAAAGTPAPPTPAAAVEPVRPAGPFVWSAEGTLYHKAGCERTKDILKKNRREGNEPPKGYARHVCLTGPAKTVAPAATKVVAGPARLVAAPEAAPAAAEAAKPAGTYVWSAEGNLYHVSGCERTKDITKKNRREGGQPPAGYKRHTCVAAPAKAEPAAKPAATKTEPAPLKGPYVWSAEGNQYHVPACERTKDIKKANLKQGAKPPTGYKPHSCVAGVTK